MKNFCWKSCLAGMFLGSGITAITTWTGAQLGVYKPDAIVLIAAIACFLSGGSLVTLRVRGEL